MTALAKFRLRSVLSPIYTVTFWVPHFSNTRALLRCFSLGDTHHKALISPLDSGQIPTLHAAVSLESGSRCSKLRVTLLAALLIDPVASKLAPPGTHSQGLRYRCHTHNITCAGILHGTHLLRMPAYTATSSVQNCCHQQALTAI